MCLFFALYIVNKYFSNVKTPPISAVESSADYKVNQILDCKKVCGRLFYLINWKGYGPE